MLFLLASGKALGSFLSLAALQKLLGFQKLICVLPAWYHAKAPRREARFSCSSVGDARGGTVLCWVCCFGSTEELELCLFVAGCRAYFQNGGRFSPPRLPVQSFEICSVCSEGEGLALRR